MPLTKWAYFPGDDMHPAGNRPRCTQVPSQADIADDRALRRGTWECALWADHGLDANPRYQGHNWVQTGEDD